MNMNMPNVPASSGGSKPFYQIWIDALTKPSENTYSEMASSPSASVGKAYLWVFLTSLVSYFIVAVIEILITSLGFGGRGLGLSGLGGSLIGIICAVPFVAAIVGVVFLIGTAIIQWIASLFKGVGTFSQLAYVFSGISAPLTLVSSVLSIFYAIPFLGLCLWPLSILLFLYAVVLEIIGVKAVNKFGWGEAIGSVLLPAVVLGVVCGCVTIVSLMIMGPVIGNVFSSINQSLQGVP